MGQLVQGRDERLCPQDARGRMPMDRQRGNPTWPYPTRGYVEPAWAVGIVATWVPSGGAAWVPGFVDGSGIPPAAGASLACFLFFLNHQAPKPRSPRTATAATEEATITVVSPSPPSPMSQVGSAMDGSKSLPQQFRSRKSSLGEQQNVHGHKGGGGNGGQDICFAAVRGRWSANERRPHTCNGSSTTNATEAPKIVCLSHP